MSTTRREFLHAAVVLGGASALGSTLGAAGCSSSPAPADAPAPRPDTPVAPADSGPFTCGGTTADIAANHGHAITVPLADVTAGTDRTYDITGTSLHMHAVTVTAADFATLATGAPVTVTSTTGGGHTHRVTVRCTAA